jgi:hypothetical protein
VKPITSFSQKKSRQLVFAILAWTVGPMVGLIMTVGISTMMGWVY